MQQLQTNRGKENTVRNAVSESWFRSTDRVWSMSWQTSFTLHMPYMPLFLKWMREYIFMLMDELNWHNSVSEKLLGDVSVGKRIAYVKKRHSALFKGLSKVDQVSALASSMVYS